MKMFTKNDIMKAMEKASQGHRQKMEVKRMLDGMDEYAEKVLSTIADGSYRNRIEYRELKLTGNNGKCRDILSPSLYTRVLQIAWMVAIGAIGVAIHGHRLGSHIAFSIEVGHRCRLADVALRH